MASEAGVLPIPEEKIVRKWRLQPGKMLLIDLEQGRIIDDEELKQTLADAEPYEEWLKRDAVQARGAAGRAERRAPALPNDPATLLDRQQAFGYTQEDLQFFLEPMAQRRRRPGRLDGHRHAARRALEQAEAALQLLQAELRAGHQPADRPDPRGAGDVAGLDDRAAAEPARPPGRHAQAARSGAADPDQRATWRRSARSTSCSTAPSAPRTLDITWPAAEGADGLEAALDRICREATDAVLADINILILSDRAVVGRARPDPGAAGDRGGAPPPDPPGPAHADRPRRRDRRGARGAPFLRARRLRRRGDQPLSRLRDAGADPRRRTACR